MGVVGGSEKVLGREMVDDLAKLHLNTLSPSLLPSMMNQGNNYLVSPWGEVSHCSQLDRPINSLTRVPSGPLLLFSHNRTETRGIHGAGGLDETAMCRTRCSNLLVRAQLLD